MDVPDNWFEDFFHGLALDLWRKALPAEHTQREAAFLMKLLNCSPGDHVLDVPCGNGRLSFALARRGLRVTGIDISEEFIEEAQATTNDLMNPSADADGTDLVAQARATNPSADPDPAESIARTDFILGDMRNIEGEAVYDGAYCFGNSFGFMEYSDMERFLRGVARALKPGARFIVNTGMAAESVLPDFEEQSCHEIGDITTTIKERYNAPESCVDSEYIFERGGKKETGFAKHWIYTAAEIRRMLERAGLQVLECYGSLNCEPFKLGSRELFVVSEMPKPDR